MKSRRENFSYSASGLPGVTLKAVEVSRCPNCGEFEVSIPRIEQLHRTLASVLIQKGTPFTGAEIRFLRKFLGWSGSDFAQHIGVTPETVSRWEQGKETMSAPADRALRLMVVTREPAAEYPLERLKDIARGKPKVVRIGLRALAKAWEPVSV
jgi:putative zinc finger/helix-turn-helix YgiT family protein